MSRLILSAYLIIIIGVASCHCSQPDQPTSSPGTTLTGNYRSDSTTIPVPTDWVLTEHVYQADVWVSSDQSWLDKLGITPSTGKAVVVNASNEEVTRPGGGLDGSLANWARSAGLKPWKNAVLADGTPAARLEAGRFALFSTNFGWIYLAVGPRASGVSSLEAAKNKVSELYNNMLCKAQQDGAERIVLPAISTVIFADKGPGFTKEEFIGTIYKGMIQGIASFQQKHPGHILKIILNNWDKKVVEKVKKLNS